MGGVKPLCAAPPPGVELQPTCKGQEARDLALRRAQGPGRAVTRPWEAAAASPAAQPSAQQQLQPWASVMSRAWKHRPPRSGLQMRQPPSTHGHPLGARRELPTAGAVGRDCPGLCLGSVPEGHRLRTAHTRGNRAGRARPSRPHPTRGPPVPPQLPVRPEPLDAAPAGWLGAVTAARQCEPFDGTPCCPPPSEVATRQ